MTINSPMKLMKHFNKIARMDRSKAYVNMQKAYTNGKVEAGLFSTSSSMKKTDKKIEKSNIFLDKNMLEAEPGGTILISGHSNTTPALVNQLIGEARYQQFEDSDYDNLFIVIAEKVGKGTVVKLTF